jgi:hypothetical protein
VPSWAAGSSLQKIFKIRLVPYRQLFIGFLAKLQPTPNGPQSSRKPAPLALFFQGGYSPKITIYLPYPNKGDYLLFQLT